MQGLLSGAQAAPEPQQQAPAPEAGAEPQAQASEGTQEQYDITAGQMIKFIHSEAGLNAIKGMSQGGNVQAAMANIIGRLMTRVAQSAAMSGKMIPPKVLFQAGIELTRVIAKLAVKQGVIQENDTDIAESAFFDGIAIFAEEAGDEALSPQERQQYVQLIDALEQLEQQHNANIQGGSQ